MYFFILTVIIVAIVVAILVHKYNNHPCCQMAGNLWTNIGNAIAQAQNAALEKQQTKSE